MKNRIPKIVLLLACSFLTGMAVAGKELPYQGQAQGQVVEAIYVAEPQVGGGAFLWERAEAVGTFTHAGRCRIELEWLVGAEEVEGELVYVLTGSFRMMTARGDSMEGVFWSRQKASGSAYVIQVTLSGGTGKFAGATGVMRGKGVREGNAFAYGLAGLIDYGP